LETSIGSASDAMKLASSSSAFAGNGLSRDRRKSLSAILVEDVNGEGLFERTIEAQRHVAARILRGNIQGDFVTPFRDG
jgi:hypothetical protein